MWQGLLCSLVTLLIRLKKLPRMKMCDVVVAESGCMCVCAYVPPIKFKKAKGTAQSYIQKCSTNKKKVGLP